MNRRVRQALFLLTGVASLAAAFAMVEIQIEGAEGWAAGLPTWRVEGGLILKLLWGGRVLTGYHVWIFLFMAMVFHLALVLTGRFRIRLEARILGALMLFWVLEDALWFVFNPAYGIGKLRPGAVPWHPRWLGIVPVDYVTFGISGLALILWSFRLPRRPVRIAEGEG